MLNHISDDKNRIDMRNWDDNPQSKYWAWHDKTGANALSTLL